jgi:NADH:ubiquinone oxidoreductase subunit D
LAPTPTHAHHLSRETSRDELEMAESLRLLNQAHEHHRPRTETPSQEQQQIQSPGDERSEIYHSLEDAVPISEQPATPATSASLQLPNMNYDASNAPVTGQVCR